MQTNRNESCRSTGYGWAGGFHSATDYSLGAQLENDGPLFVEFSNFFSDCGKPWITENGLT